MGVVGGVFASRDVSERAAGRGGHVFEKPPISSTISLALFGQGVGEDFCNLKRREKIRIVLG